MSDAIEDFKSKAMSLSELVTYRDSLGTKFQSLHSALAKAIKDVQWAQSQGGCTCDPYCVLKFNHQEGQFNVITTHTCKP
jgi:hypothetical protein